MTRRAGSLSAVLALAVVAGWAVLALAVFDPKPDTGGDNAVYLALAQSIRSGAGFRDIHLPGAPADTQYPFGFPLLLAGLFSVTGFSLFAAKLLVLACGMGAVWFLAQLAGVSSELKVTSDERGGTRKGRGSELKVTSDEREVRSGGRKVTSDARGGPAWPALAFAASIPALAAAGSRVLTELPFLLLSLAALHFILRGDDEDSDGLRWLGVALAVGGMLVRTAGIALVLALAVHWLARRQWRFLAGTLALAAVALVPWQMRGHGTGYFGLLLAKDPYVAEFGRVTLVEFLARCGRNLGRYVFDILPATLLPLPAAGVARPVAGAALAGFIAFGAWRLRRRGVVLLYAGFAGLVLVAWPETWTGERFLLPLAPVLCLLVAAEVTAMARRHPRAATVALVALTALNLVALGRAAGTSIAANRQYLAGDRYAGYAPGWRRYFQACAWMRDSLPQDAVVLARKPEFVWLAGGHRARGYPFTNDRARVQRALDSCDYILLEDESIGSTAGWFLIPVLHLHPERYRTVHATGPPETFVLRIER